MQVQDIDKQMGEVVLYETADSEISLEVRFERENVWLTRQQMAILFDRNRTVIARHIRNIYSEGELNPDSTSAKFALVHFEGSREVSRNVEYYDLDVIVSVGYRVRSTRGTQFRTWATRTLRKHLFTGFTLNEKRLAEIGLSNIRETLEKLSPSPRELQLVDESKQTVQNLIEKYTQTWRLLLSYDQNKFSIPLGTKANEGRLSYEQALEVIDIFRHDLISKGEGSSLFGQEQGDTLKSILGNVEQTMFGEPLYRSLEARAAHLLYFIVKDHPFIDGNKRIAALLFLLYLSSENFVHQINPKTLTTLTLCIAESDYNAKDLMISLVVQLLQPDGD